MHCPLQPSWIEQTIDLCDEVLVRAARAHPANLLLRKLAGNITVTQGPAEKAELPSCTQLLAS